MQLSRPLDAIDRKIVALLRQDAKLTFAEIGTDVGLSSRRSSAGRSPRTRRRNRRVRGRIDASALGEGIEALIEVYCADRIAPADVGRSLVDLDEVVSAFTVSGEPDAVIRARVESIAGLEKFVNGSATIATCCGRGR